MQNATVKHAQISCLILCEQTDAINLMKNWIMRCIDLISSKDITNEQERIKT